MPARLLIFCLSLLTVSVPAARQRAAVPAPVPAVPARGPLTAGDDAFLEDLSRRAFLFFWEQADPGSGLIRDRSGRDGGPSANAGARGIASIASVGFGLSGMCIAADRGWLPRERIVERTRTTLRFLAGTMPQEHGWFYHFVDLATGARAWQSELSSIDTALLLGGVLTAGRCFASEPEIPVLADAIYRRVDFAWMLNGDAALLSHGWKPDTGFLTNRWDHYCELMILYVLAIGSPTHPIPAASWRAWSRPVMSWGDFRYVSGPDPLFVHQYSHAWIDFRERVEAGTGIDWFANSVTATRAHKAFCLSLSGEFPGYTDHVWGITASDSPHGYVAWGGPPRHPAIDGTVVPAAAAGSLMFDPAITVPALRTMRERFGSRVYGRYGFADAFHPRTGWTDPDVIGIDLGIGLLSAENLRTGRVWSWFMQNAAIGDALARAGVVTRP